jgi:alginate O-acetyltransferase complex protein AlgI
MLFSSSGFIFCFLPIVLTGFYWLTAEKRIEPAKLWLIASSIVFYANFIPIHLLVLGGSTVTNFLLGCRLLEARSRLVLSVGIAFNLLILAIFKYADFVVANINGLLKLQLPTFGIVLPLGLSFFTFQKMAYLVDVYRGGAPRYRFRDFVLFVVFFPQLIAGPIVHHRQIMPQIAELGRERELGLDLSVGATAFIVGLFKKIVIADSLAFYSDATFSFPAHGASLDLLSAWAGTLAFTLQIYFDFSGYSDMALGLGRMFGIRLPVNFRSPYKATSIIDFWRRWHITLSEFLRDYLYIPLGGNRRGPVRRYVNLFLVMLLGGLWHGANWTFIAWGGLHGLYLSANHAFDALKPMNPFGVSARLFAWLATFGGVVIAWVFFRAPDFATAFSILGSMFGLHGIILPSFASRLHTVAPELVNTLNISFGGTVILASGGATRLLWFPIGAFVCLVAPCLAEWLSPWRLSFNQIETNPSQRVIDWKPSLMWGVALGILFTFTVIYQQSAVQFLYFQF